MRVDLDEHKSLALTEEPAVIKTSRRVIVWLNVGSKIIGVNVVNTWRFLLNCDIHGPILYLLGYVLY